MLLLALLLLQGALLSGSQPGAPQNVTIIFLDPKTVQVLWSNSDQAVVDKYDVSYKPVEAKIVTVVAGNSDSITLQGLQPDAQYQLTVTAVRGGVKARSRPIVFKTLAPLTDPPPTPLDSASSSVEESAADASRYTPLTSLTVRGVEISLVLLALCVWVFAITLFFHRWGKIRMLLPYQPDYKTQQSLKVPGTGSTGCSGEGGPHTEATGCVQHLRWSSRYLDEPQQRPASRWSSRQRLSVAAFSGYSPACTQGSPERMRHARSHASLHGISIPVPARRASRGSIYSLVDCLKARQAEEEPLFVVPDTEVQETALDSPPKRTHPPLRPAKTEDRLMTPAEMRRKTFLRKISLQETHINYNQDYWLEYEKNTRFHTSLDLGKCTPITPEPPKSLGPKESIIQTPSAKRQSDFLPSKPKRKFTRGDSEPYIVVNKKCSCNECGPEGKRKLDRAATTNDAPTARRPAQQLTLDISSVPSRGIFANAIRTPSTENLPFLERVGHIETDFNLETSSQCSLFSDVSLDQNQTSELFSEANLVSDLTGPESESKFSFRSSTFDFTGGSAFFGEVPLAASTTSLPENVSMDQSMFSIPHVSISRPSNSPSPLGP